MGIQYTCIQQKRRSSGKKEETEGCFIRRVLLLSLRSLILTLKGLKAKGFKCMYVRERVCVFERERQIEREGSRGGGGYCPLLMAVHVGQGHIMLD